MMWKIIVVVALVFLCLYLFLLIVRRFISIGKNKSADRFFSLYKTAHDVISAVEGVAEEYHSRTEEVSGSADRKKRIIIGSALAFSRKKLDDLSPDKQFERVLKGEADRARLALDRAMETAEKSGSGECIAYIETCAGELTRILASGEEIKITEALRTIETIITQANAIAEMKIEEISGQKKTHYGVLGISHEASIEQIREVYRKLATKFHPDQFTWATEEYKSEMGEKMQKINEAYEILSDPEKREEYDASIERGA